MHVLLTRPLEDSIDLIKRFKEKDITVSHLPLIKINKLDYPKLKSSEYNVIVFTSSNAIRNLDTKDFNKNMFFYLKKHWNLRLSIGKSLYHRLQTVNEKS